MNEFQSAGRKYTSLQAIVLINARHYFRYWFYLSLNAYSGIRCLNHADVIPAIT